MQQVLQVGQQPVFGPRDQAGVVVLEQVRHVTAGEIGRHLAADSAPTGLDVLHVYCLALGIELIDDLTDSG
jgi:hypothetical protein